MSLKFKALNISANFVVAIDGLAASGKSTIGRMLAQKFNLIYFQSSIVYRTLALKCINQKVDLNNQTEIIALSGSIEYIQDPELHNEYIATVASKIAIIPEVRSNLGKYLVKLIRETPRIIMEGRDIGTVIAPSAHLKIFIKADVTIRAKRRYKELQKKGKDYILSEILSQLKERDKRDQERSVAPLIQSKDALVLDSTNLAPIEIIKKIVEFISIR